jgi:cell division septation protein DedD
MRTLILLAGLSLAATTGLAAEHYFKWQDANGVWHYTQQPPPEGVASERINVATGRAEPAPAPAPANASPEAAATAANNAEVEKRRREACQAARANVATIEANPTVTMLNADGTQRTLSPEETQRQLELARAQVTLYCSPAPR